MLSLGMGCSYSAHLAANAAKELIHVATVHKTHAGVVCWARLTDECCVGQHIYARSAGSGPVSSHASGNFSGVGALVCAWVTQSEQALSLDWGLDHGTWSVLVHMFPQTSVPVLQLSIDSRLPPAAHVALGRLLAPLRDEGVLILASGNVVHNLRHALGQLHVANASTPPWALAFDTDVTQALLRRDLTFLEQALNTDQGRTAHPTPGHYLPLLYAAGALHADDNIAFPIEGFDAGSISMRSVQFG